MQDGLEGARFFCIIFSKNSLASEWVKREITASLLLEIENRKVMILPIVIDDCKLPLLVRDKIYADFRGDFEEGLKKLLSVILPYYQTQSSGRVSSNDHYYLDYSGFTEEADGRILCEIDVISYDLEETYSILTQLKFESTEAVTLETLELQTIQEVTDLLFRTCVDEFARNPARVVVSPGKKTLKHFTILDKDGSLLFNVTVIVKIIGNKHKGAIAFNVGALFSQMGGSLRSE